jgi:hypothetical protein
MSSFVPAKVRPSPQGGTAFQAIRPYLRRRIEILTRPTSEAGEGGHAPLKRDRADRNSTIGCLKRDASHPLLAARCHHQRHQRSLAPRAKATKPGPELPCRRLDLPGLRRARWEKLASVQASRGRPPLQSHGKTSQLCHRYETPSPAVARKEYVGHAGKPISLSCNYRCRFRLHTVPRLPQPRRLAGVIPPIGLRVKPLQIVDWLGKLLALRLQP